MTQRSLDVKHTWTSCNVATSAMVCECELGYITRAGVEIGVASTKACTMQLAGLYLLTLAPAQVRGRGGQLCVTADDSTHIESEPGVHLIRVPEHLGALSPILHVVPLQRLAYHTACARGTDVDKPRNLAKGVTVE